MCFNISHRKIAILKTNTFPLYHFYSLPSHLFPFTNKFLDSIVYIHCLYFLNSHAFLNPAQTSLAHLSILRSPLLAPPPAPDLYTFCCGSLGLDPLPSHLFEPYSHPRQSNFFHSIKQHLYVDAYIIISLALFWTPGYLFNWPFDISI